MRAFLTLLPYHQQVIHSRWSGEAVWIPLGEFDLGVSFENHTTHGSRGDVLFYPGGYSETEFLFVYGSSSFAAKMGALAGNHILTMLEGHEYLQAFGKKSTLGGCSGYQLLVGRMTHQPHHFHDNTEKGHCSWTIKL